MLLIGQLVWIVNHGKEEKSNTYTYYKPNMIQISKNYNVGDDEDHLEAPHRAIIAVNVAKNNARICQS